MTIAETPLDRRRWRALGVIALVQFMLVLDVTVVNVALPHIQSDLHFSRAGLAWVVDGYVLTAGGLLLLGGRLGDLLGRRRMFVVGLLVFSVASALSGAASDPAMLVTSRFLQGVGEAIASPAAFGLVALLFTDPKERASAIGIFGGVAGLGGTLGPVVSGLLISASSWRWIFFVNIPVGLFAAAATLRMVDESRAERRADAPRPDLAGAVLGTGGLAGIVYGFIAAGNHPWGATQVVASLALGVAALGAFVVRERVAPDPLVPAGFLRNGTRVSANLACVFFASVFFTMFFLLTLYWQQVEHYSTITTGVAYLPFGIVIGLGIAVSSAVVTKVGPKVLLLAGSLFVTAGVLLLSRITVHGSYLTQTLPALVVAAFGSGLSFAAFGNASMHEVSGQDASLASGLQSTAQQVGGAVGLAVLATLALRHTRASMAHGVAFSVASTHGAVLAFRIGALVSLAGGVLVALSPIARAASAPVGEAHPLDLIEPVTV
ncbi:MAG TPA: DHA2 family efflux MFS transporter permease subunit [Acidimicrobiales bacterium]|nr:DHA2 family efflux MFS transporter permease subunit [Acidimicrobiales bacterium]